MLRRLTLATLFAAVCVSSTALAQPVEACSVMVKAGDTMKVEPVSGYTITNATTPLRLPDSYPDAVAIVCERSTLTIGDNDYRVLTDLEVPLFVKSSGRTVVFEMVSGQFLLQVADGELTQEEIAGLQVALNRAQSLSQGDTK
jgi:hypothetical protein